MKKILGLILASLLLANLAYAAPVPTVGLRIGILDMQQIMQKSALVMNINKRLESKFKPRQTDIIAKQKELRGLAEKYNREGTTMATSARTNLQNTIIAKQKALQDAMNNFRRDLAKDQAAGMQELSSKLMAALKTIAKSNGLNLVLLKKDVPYADDNLDITNVVLPYLAH